MTRALALFLLALMVLPMALHGAPGQTNDSEAPPKFVPPGPKKSVEIGDFYFKRKRYKGALSRYKEALQADPHYAPAYLGLGKVYEKIGLKQKALEAYQTYLDELPSKKDADEAKDVHRAMERLTRQLAATPSKPEKRR